MAPNFSTARARCLPRLLALMSHVPSAREREDLELLATGVACASGLPFELIPPRMIEFNLMLMRKLDISGGISEHAGFCTRLCEP